MSRLFRDLHCLGGEGNTMWGRYNFSIKEKVLCRESEWTQNDSSCNRILWMGLGEDKVPVHRRFGAGYLSLRALNDDWKTIKICDSDASRKRNHDWNTRPNSCNCKGKRSETISDRLGRSYRKTSHIQHHCWHVRELDNIEECSRRTIGFDKRGRRENTSDKMAVRRDHRLPIQS